MKSEDFESVRISCWRTNGERISLNLSRSLHGDWRWHVWDDARGEVACGRSQSAIEAQRAAWLEAPPELRRVLEAFNPPRAEEEG